MCLSACLFLLLADFFCLSIFLNLLNISLSLSMCICIFLLYFSHLYSVFRLYEIFNFSVAFSLFLSPHLRKSFSFCHRLYFSHSQSLCATTFIISLHLSGTPFELRSTVIPYHSSLLHPRLTFSYLNFYFISLYIID